MIGKLLILKIGFKKFKRFQKVKQTNSLIMKIIRKLEYLAILKIKFKIKKTL